MADRCRRWMNFICVAGLTVGILSESLWEEMPVLAVTSAEMQQQIAAHQKELEGIQEKLEDLEEQQDIIEEKIADLNAEIINMMTSIGLKEDEIAAKEQELIEKQDQIDQTEAEYLAAKAREEKQHADMVIRTRRMYENGGATYLSSLLSGVGLGDLLNRMDYIEKIYEYDRDKLLEFEATKNQVHDLWDRLELEKQGLEADKLQLEIDRAALQSQKDNLDVMLAQKKKESANYDAEIKKAKQEASVAKKLIQQEQKKLKQLQDAEKKKNNAANLTYTSTSYTEIIDNASGSDMGKKVAKYACQYIGNPYVYGGTSLTNGADCSGFVFRVYSDFGTNLPRTSYEQRSSGTGVSYSEAQPGDLICYDGHIGIYIGGGKIVHASTERTGIKVSNATYRSILSVRRIVE